jgi:penicillin G amidase
MSLPHLTNPDVVPDAPLTPEEAALKAKRRRIFFRIAIILSSLVIISAVVGLITARRWVRQTMSDSLPQLDGAVAIPGLSAPVTIQRDTHGVPHIRATTLDDLVLAQGFVTTQDRLWQMDALRRHATGSLAEILGPSLLSHDRLQRTLQIRAAADRAIATLPPGQLHLLERYAAGVNASIAIQSAHLPLEFRVLRYQPEPWTPRDTILIGLVMFQDLTTSFPSELNREALTARLPQNLISDLYPTVTWRDHPPAQPIIDLTTPQQNIPDVPLDESQTKLELPDDDSLFYRTISNGLKRSVILSEADRRFIASRAVEGPAFFSGRRDTQNQKSTASPTDLLTLQQTLRNPVCENCFAGSNNWVVSGAHTATGKPLLSNDMHLAANIPGIWYQADLEAPNLHVTGVSLPGAPFIIVGHNDHVAWGFTNLGAEVQDVYIEHLRGTGASAEFESNDGTWHPILRQQEIIHVKGSKDVVLEVPATKHGTAITPIISSILPTERRALALRWIIYDPANITPSFLDIDTATDGASLVSAFSAFGGPAQNVVYADDQGHIGYHAVGHIPLRGSSTVPSPISPVPVDALDTTQDWAGLIPYDKLPQTIDPPNGILATANNRVTPDDYPYPINTNWGSPYRNQRIWKVLTDKSISTHNKLTPADMLALQTDVYSDVDHVIAERLAYAIDHATKPEFTQDKATAKRLHQAADLLRAWNGSVDADSPAAAIVVAARTTFWPLLLNPQITAPSKSQPNAASKSESAKETPVPAAALYTWYNKPYAEEWLIMHTPSRWLPKDFATWDDLLTTAVSDSLRIANAPADLSTWRYGQFHPVEIEHPVYGQSAILQRLTGVPTGTGVQPQSGDDVTVKQVGRTFGPSERFTADLADFDHSTLNLVLGQSGNPLSPWFMDQWPAWYHGTTFPLPFTHSAVDASTTHTLTLNPR